MAWDLAPPRPPSRHRSIPSGTASTRPWKGEKRSSATGRPLVERVVGADVGLHRIPVDEAAVLLRAGGAGQVDVHGDAGLAALVAALLALAVPRLTQAHGARAWAVHRRLYGGAEQALLIPDLPPPGP